MSLKIETLIFWPKHQIKFHSTKSKRKACSIFDRTLSASTQIAPTNHPINADASIQLIGLGMQIDWNEHDSKHDSSIRFNLDSDPNEMDPNSFRFRGWPVKQDVDRISTEMGMQIDCNEQNAKHNPSILFNLDPGSTEPGMQIDCNERNSKRDSSIRFNRDPGTFICTTIGSDS
jgi:hypothetical protein